VPWLQSANIQRFSNLTLNLDEGFSTAVYRFIGLYTLRAVKKAAFSSGKGHLTAIDSGLRNWRTALAQRFSVGNA
jgi:hypothetical protein